jgi:hypothetical protein
MCRKYFSLTLISASFLVMILFSCTKEEVKEADPDPENPFSPVVNPIDTDTTTTVTPDPYSITGLHKNIFSTKCNVPGCHDGTFEPDFRTIQSTYSTLVYQQVNKVTVNNVDSFDLRVIPFDTINSFLHERITTPTTEYMPSNGNRLSQIEIQQINTWIMNGARDINGNIPSAPNNLPHLINDGTRFFYNALDSFTVIPFYASVVDTNRYLDIPYYPFLVNAGANLQIIFWVTDDSTAIGSLQVNQCKLSLLENDFSAAQTVTATYVNLGAPNQFWIASFPVTWPVGTQVYFRYYVRDSDNPAVVEFPRSDLPFYYKSFFSFRVQ